MRPDTLKTINGPSTALKLLGMSLNPSVPRGVAPPSPDTRNLLEIQELLNHARQRLASQWRRFGMKRCYGPPPKEPPTSRWRSPSAGGGRGWRRGSSVPPRTRTSVVVATAPRGRGPHGNGPRPPEGRGPSSRLLNGPPLTDGALISRLPIEQPLCRYPRRNCGQSLTRIRSQLLPPGTNGCPAPALLGTRVRARPGQSEVAQLGFAARGAG